MTEINEETGSPQPPWDFEAEGKRYAASLPAEVSPIRKTSIADLRSRAKRLVCINIWLLVVIVVVLGGAAWLVYNANDITNKDAGLPGPVAALLTNQISEQRSRLDGLRGIVQHTQMQYERGQSILAGHLGKPDYEGLAKIFGGPPVAVESARRDITFAEQDLQKSQELLQKALDLQKPKDREPANTVPLLIAAGVTRFGVIAIVIFLVQILVGLYRYNARTASAYLAEADALAFLDLEHEKLAVLIKAVTPSVGFGKETTTIVEKMLDTAKTAAEKTSGKC